MKKIFTVLAILLSFSTVSAQGSAPKNELSINVLGLSRIENMRKNPYPSSILTLNRSKIINNEYNPYRNSAPFGVGYKRKLNEKNLYLRTGIDYFKNRYAINYFNNSIFWPYPNLEKDTLLYEHYTYSNNSLTLRVGLEKRKRFQNINLHFGIDILYLFKHTTYNYSESITINNSINPYTIRIGDPIVEPIKGMHKKSNNMLGFMPNWGMSIEATKHFLIGAEMSITAMFNQRNEFEMSEDKLYATQASKFAFNLKPDFCAFNITYRI